MKNVERTFGKERKKERKYTQFNNVCVCLMNRDMERSIFVVSFFFFVLLCGAASTTWVSGWGGNGTEGYWLPSQVW